MAIQSSVNQAIGAASIMAGLYSQSPTGKRRAELRDIKSSQKILDKKLELAGEPTEARGVELHRELSREEERLAERKFVLDPSDKNYQTLENLYKEHEDWGLYDDEKPQTALAQSQEKMTYEQLRKGVQKMALKERAQFLKETSHIQAQEKRAEQKKKYEEAKK